MATPDDLCAHCVRNRLTTIKLALQLLRRRTPMSVDQRRLVRLALDAADALAAEAGMSRRVAG